ncbi:F-box protein At5g49610-like [Rhododendron vialii]|uniref:F-box protein At5g49610-like n=1 Tax=Rhododendron vialii TaxID=182163 RepID=UPI00265FF7D9|nr:F-box protein At5g49610-like [Rhododendron vialii]
MPEDVLMLILSRLPVKSLLRFKSVCKNWYSLIQSPCFISLHNNRSPKKESLLVKRLIKPHPTFSLSLVSNETPIHDLDVPFVSPRFHDLHLSGSSNGVVCLTDPSTKIIMLYNPAMREFRLLPQPYFGIDNICNGLGFAFDPKTNDYKVLIVVRLYKTNDRRVQIYDTSTDSWREIVAIVPKDIQFCSRPYRLTWLDGVFYWVASDPNSSYYTIIAFHMFDELFEQVFLPEVFRIASVCSLSVLRGSLALVTSELGSLTAESCLDIWVRDGNGVKDPWNKKYSIGPKLRLHDLLGFRQNGELLLSWGGDFQMVSYNLSTQNIKEYDLRSINFEVLSYTENLVSVKRCVY